VGLALLTGSVLASGASAQGIAKGAPGLGKGPVGTVKPGTVKPWGSERRISFSMAKKPWQGESGVLKWLSDELGIPLVGKSFPTGSFTFTPPVVNGVVQTYTLPEVVDLINQQLQREKWVLIRYKDHFTVLPADTEIANFPRIDLDELDQRAGSEVVSLVYPLRKHSAVEMAAEVQKMLTQPFGKVVTLEASNRLILQDTVHSLKQVLQTIRSAESGPDTGTGGRTVFHYTCQYQVASEAAEHLKQLLGDEKEEPPSGNPKGEKKVQVQPRGYKIAVDEASNTVLLTGSVETIGKARDILRNFDRGTEKVAVGQPFLKMYSVPGGNADALSKILQEVYKSSPKLKVAAVNSTTIAVWAGPEMQIRIAKEIMPTKEDDVLISKSEFIPLAVSDPEKLATFLQNAFPSEKGKIDGPTIDADVSRNGILVRGTEAQVKEIRRAIVSIEGQDASVPSVSGMRIIPLDPGVSAASLAEALKGILEKMRPDIDLKLVIPGRDLGKPELEKKPEPPKQLPRPRQTSRRSSPAKPGPAGTGADPLHEDWIRVVADPSLNSLPGHARPLDMPTIRDLRMRA
jgi:hypothetical protein